MVYFDVPIIDGHKVVNIDELSSNHIQEIIQNEDNVIFSSINDTNIRKIPKSNVKSIIFSDGNISDFTYLSNKFPKIKSIGFEYINISSFKGFGNNLSKIRQLFFNQNSIQSYNGLQKSFPNLESISITDCELPNEEFPSQLNKLSKIEIAYSSPIRFKKILSSINLENLHIIQSNVKDFELKSAKNIIIESIDPHVKINSKSKSQSLKFINSELRSLSNISDILLNSNEINLSYNKLNEKSFSNKSYNNVKSLNLSNNTFRSTSFLQNFQSLENLNLDNNEIKSVESLPLKLKTLSIQNNRNKISFNFLTNSIEEINFTGTKIDNFIGLPKSMPYLKKIIAKKSEIKNLEGFPQFPISKKTIIDVRKNPNLKLEGINKEMFAPFLLYAKYDPSVIKDDVTRQCILSFNERRRNSDICFYAWLNNQSYIHNLNLYNHENSPEDQTRIENHLSSKWKCENLNEINFFSSIPNLPPHKKEYLHNLESTISSRCFIKNKNGLKILL